MGESSWAQQRRENARARAELLRAREQAESTQASAHLARFVAAAKREGLHPEKLTVRNPANGVASRTQLLGWYLKEDRSVAVGEDGLFYLLTAPLSWLDRFRTITPKASAPPLILGKGGRDGESIDLTEALDKRLPNWRR